jgi:hypothetical protein
LRALAASRRRRREASLVRWWAQRGRRGAAAQLTQPLDLGADVGLDVKPGAGHLKKHFDLIEFDIYLLDI